MPAKKRIQTKYPGVHYIEGRTTGSKRKERIYYIVYRQDGKQVEKSVGRQFQDEMTPAMAHKIRKKYLESRKSSPKIKPYIIKSIKGKEKKHIAKQLIEEASQSIEKDIEIHQQDRPPLGIPEDEFRSFVETASDLMDISDENGNFIYVNESFSKTLGYTKNEMIGMNVFQILPKKTGIREFKANLDIIIKKGSLDIETSFITKSGEEIFVESKSVAFYDPDGNYAGGRGVFRDITDRKRAENILKERDMELSIKNKTLEEVNTALRVLLKKRGEDKDELEYKVFSNVQELVFPYLEKLKNSGLNARQESFIDILESNIKEIASPSSSMLSGRYLKLTPSEIQIANLVKHGKTSKEIAALLSLSDHTIERHRKNIRKKIGLKNKNDNLRTHLLSLYNG